MDVTACVLRALGIAFGVALGATIGAALVLGIGVLILMVTGGVVLITLGAAVAILLGWFLAVYAIEAATLIIQCVAQADAAAQAGNNQANQGLTGTKGTCVICGRLHPYWVAGLIVVAIKLLPLGAG
jgi:hypothetical protein